MDTDLVYLANFPNPSLKYDNYPKFPKKTKSFLHLAAHLTSPIHQAQPELKKKPTLVQKNKFSKRK